MYKREGGSMFREYSPMLNKRPQVQHGRDLANLYLASGLDLANNTPTPAFVYYKYVATTGFRDLKLLVVI